MIGRALDENNDLIVERGQFKLVRDGAEVVQHVRSRLLFYLNEWFLDLSAGTPYFEQIFVKPVNLSNVESIIQTRILETPGVQNLIEFNTDYSGGRERRLSVSFTAQTTFGEIINSEVTING